VTDLRRLPIPAGPAALSALPVLRQALDGEFAVLPYAAGGRPPTVPDATDPEGAGPDGAVPDGAVPDGTALVVGTSGSTGTPKLAMLPATALTASAAATHERLGGPGSWLLAMPPHHIAGVQVLLRCIAAGTHPGFVDLSEGFTPGAFIAASTSFHGDRRYTALVPTQLVRLLDDPVATVALAGFDAVLVGGAASTAAMLAKARAAGVSIVTTYGMSETSGGCVYDGIPLSPTEIRVDADGRIHLGGDTLATGYLGRPDLTTAAFGTDSDGRRWFRTDDVGHLDGEGRWHVDGRLDDLITTGGLKVAPRLVEEALTALPDIAEAVVVATADEHWGQAVSAAVVLTGPANRPGNAAPTVDELRELLRGILPPHALPRRLLVLSELPLRGPGKPDRSAVAARFANSA
jgi:O-succinylbenzoic acid--CoA ligase